MNFTESLTELLSLVLFPKLPQTVIGFTEHTVSLGGNRDSHEMLQALVNKPLQAVMKKNKSHPKATLNLQNFLSKAGQHFLQFCGSWLHSQQCHQMINDLNLRLAITAHSH